MNKKVLISFLLFCSFLFAKQNLNQNVFKLETYITKNGKIVKIRIPKKEMNLGNLNINYFTKFVNILLNYRIKRMNFKELKNPFIFIEPKENKNNFIGNYKIIPLVIFNNSVIVKYQKLGINGKVISSKKIWLRKGEKAGKCILEKIKNEKIYMKCNNKKIILQLNKNKLFIK